jgi:choline dehydrogenase-like flavoprotein
MTPDVRRPAADAVVVGMGWAGGIVAAELAQAGLRVVGLERGPERSPADTFDWHENELRIARFAAGRIREILEAMRPDHLTVHADEGHFDSARYQGTHNTGGAIMGADPATSVVDPTLRMWDCENVWVVGGSAFPQNGTPGPTGTICALAYRAADSIVRKYATPPEVT